MSDEKQLERTRDRDQLEWELSDDEDSPECMSKSLVRRVVVRLEASVSQLERFAALCILTHWDAEGCGGPPEPWPPAVKAIVDQYGSCAIDHCARCRRWAPITGDRGKGGVCAWGCAVDPPPSPP